MPQESIAPSAQPSSPAPAVQRGDQVRSITHSLRIVMRTIQEHSRWVESQCNLNASQLWTLWELFTTPGMKVSELAAALYIHQSTASNMLDKLELRGLVERRRDGPDQRIVRLYLSEGGVALLAIAPRPAQGALTAALQQLPDASLQCLCAGLDDLVAGLKFKDPNAALEPLNDD